MAEIELEGLTIARAAALFRGGELSPLELTEAYLDRIERLNPALGAYITVTAERARADARRAADELARGTDRGPLHGIPIALKDLYDTADILTTGGAKVFADRRPAVDSTVARRLREAGTVLLGKLNLHELAWGVSNDNPHYGRCCNPWNRACIPGGSSGGSAAAVAASLAIATLGTDTGGSVRTPAALCGVVGLKASFGRVSRAGVLPMSSLQDHPGPLTRTVEDTALLLQAIAGYDTADFSTVPVPVDDYRAQLGGGLRGLKIGVPRAYFYERLDDEVRAAVEAALGVLGDLGAEVREVELPGLDGAVAASFAVILAENQDFYAEPLRTRPQDLGADVAAILAQDAGDAVGLARAMHQRQAIAHRMRTALEEVDLLVTPTEPIPATPFEQELVTYGGGEESVLFAMIRLTMPFNTAGLPALTVPCGFTRAGLPIGLQLGGRPFGEATILRAGHAYEQATDWHTRRPALVE